VVRLGILHGEYHWHKHDKEDEFFFTLSGKLLLDIEGSETIELMPLFGKLFFQNTLLLKRQNAKIKKM